MTVTVFETRFITQTTTQFSVSTVYSNGVPMSTALIPNVVQTIVSDFSPKVTTVTAVAPSTLQSIVTATVTAAIQNPVNPMDEVECDHVKHHKHRHFKLKLKHKRGTMKFHHHYVAGPAGDSRSGAARLVKHSKDAAKFHHHSRDYSLSIVFGNTECDVSGLALLLGAGAFGHVQFSPEYATSSIDFHEELGFIAQAFGSYGGWYACDRGHGEIDLQWHVHDISNAFGIFAPVDWEVCASVSLHKDD